MFRGRSAILMLVMCLMLAPHSRGLQAGVMDQDRIDAGVSSYISPSSGWLTCHRLPRRAATVSQFAPWKSRIKTVIEERVYEVVDESDLGPADALVRHISAARIVPVAPPAHKLPPLRC
jgi:hypothetical protein